MPDIITDLSTFYGKIRLAIGDTEQDKGPWPSGRNFLDAELHHFYAAEGNDIGRAAAAAAETLVRAWASAPREVVLGPHRTRQDAVRHWTEIATELRRQHGSATAPKAFSGRLNLLRRTDDYKFSD